METDFQAGEGLLFAACFLAPLETYLYWLSEYSFRGEQSVQSLQLSIVGSSNFH